MTEGENSKQYDLEDRTLRVRALVRQLPGDPANIEDIRQLARASSSVGANYIEANEALSKKDFCYRVKICRKESKETRFSLRLVHTKSIESLDVERAALVQEATEFIKIFTAILRKSE